MGDRDRSVTSKGDNGDGGKSGGGGYIRKDWEAETRRGNKIRLKRAVRDAGSCSYGVVAVEVWVLSEDRTRLVRPDGGWWRSPYYEDDGGALERLEDDSLVDYVPARDLAPGVGLAGNLWLEEDDTYNYNHKHMAEQNLSELHWRRLQPIADDPDQAPDPRLPMFLRAGLGLAAGVPFNVHGYRGIVIYFTRTRARKQDLSSSHNALFLRSSADHIGAVCALAEPLRQSVVTKKNRLYKTLRRIALKIEVACAFKQSGTIGALKRKGSGTSSANRNDLSMRPSITRTGQPEWKLSRVSSIKQSVKRSFNRRITDFKRLKSLIVQKSTMLAKKARTNAVDPPPPLPATETVFVFFGSVLSLLLIQAFTEIIRIYADYTFTIFSPLGALMASQYVLTAAPASQPRNALFGNAIAATTSLIITYIPTNVLPKVVRVSIATSAAVAFQARLGVIHPPGIGFAITLASGNHNWVDVPILLGGCFLAVLSGTFLLNLNEKRQYPIYWRFFTIPPGIIKIPNIRKKFRRSDSSLIYGSDDESDGYESDWGSVASLPKGTRKKRKTYSSANPKEPPPLPQDLSIPNENHDTQNGKIQRSITNSTTIVTGTIIYPQNSIDLDEPEILNNNDQQETVAIDNGELDLYHDQGEDHV